MGRLQHPKLSTRQLHCKEHQQVSLMAPSLSSSILCRHAPPLLAHARSPSLITNLRLHLPSSILLTFSIISILHKPPQRFNSFSSSSGKASSKMPAPARAYVFGRANEATHPDSMRATLAELLSTFIFVFAGEGSALALNKMYPIDTGVTRQACSLIAIALAHGLALFAAIASSIDISGDHVNHIVTLGVLVGGRISLIRAIYYWMAQLLGAILASLMLRLVTAGMRPVGFILGSGVGEANGLLLEILMTFGLVYTVYATAIDPRRGSLVIIAPPTIGLILAANILMANILMGGPFDGAAMNPALAFGPALVGWRWGHHWIYWLGPLIGGALAGLIYEYLVIPTEAPLHTHHQPLAPEDYQPSHVGSA